MADGRKRKFIKELQTKAKLRRESGLYAVDGVRMCAELPAEEAEEVFVTKEFLASEHAALCAELLQKTGYELVSGQEMKQMSETVTPQGILALARQKRVRGIRELLAGGAAVHAGAGKLKKPAPTKSAQNGERSGEMGEGETRRPLLLLLETLQDPGNLGTILRASEAAGVTGILMNRDCVDIYAPKVVRSTMGAIFRVPFLIVDDLLRAAELLREENVKLYAAHLRSAVDYTSVSYRESCGILIGNEAHGLSDALTEKVDAAVKIPMCGSLESLNAAMAATILVFEANRQRRLRQ